jgi:hypothetical protein
VHGVGEVEPVRPDDKPSERPCDRTHGRGDVEPVRPEDDAMAAHGVVEVEPALP